MTSITTALLITGALACAQTDADKIKADADHADQIKAEVKAKLDAELQAMKVDMSGAQFGMVGGVVKGAPYSAEAITESVQVLGDGNRIRRKTTFLVFRDSEGRIVRQQEQGGVVQTVSILDPVANVAYTFDYKTQTAFTHPVAQAEADYKKKSRDAAMLKSSGRSEALSPRIMEGVNVQGQRETMTIAAEAEGNERPIEVTNERWYAPDLQVNVFTQRHDPRSGDVTFQLTKIQRGEPSRALFEIPVGFTVQSDLDAKKAAEQRVKELKAAAAKKPE